MEDRPPWRHTYQPVDIRFFGEDGGQGAGGAQAADGHLVAEVRMCGLSWLG